MTRNIFHRDFTSAKAALLAVLIGAGLSLGDVPHPSADLAAQDQHAPERVVPVLLFKLTDCDSGNTGVAL